MAPGVSGSLLQKGWIWSLELCIWVYFSLSTRVVLRFSSFPWGTGSRKNDGQNVFLGSIKQGTLV